MLSWRFLDLLRGGSGRQAEVARLLRGVEVRTLEGARQEGGGILGPREAGDAVEAAVVCLAADGEDILASDPGDFRALAEAASANVDLVSVGRWSGCVGGNNGVEIRVPMRAGLAATEGRLDPAPRRFRVGFYSVR